MTYFLDPKVLQACANATLGEKREALFAQLQTKLAAHYPQQFSQPQPPRWVFNHAGGAMGQLALLYASTREYLLMFGTPIGTEGHSGRYPTEIWDFVLDGEMWCYTEGETERHVYGPGDCAYLGAGKAKGYRIPDHAWMLEYGRGPIPLMLPFGLISVACNTLDFSAGARTFGAYSGHVLRQMLSRRRFNSTPLA